MKELTGICENIQVAESMEDEDLFASMLENLTRGRLDRGTVYEVARKMLEARNFYARMDTVSVKELVVEFGLEEQEASAFVSIAEILRRSLVKKSERKVVFSSQSLGTKLIAQIGSKEQEHLMAIYLNTQNEIIDERIISIGSNKRSVASPSDILRYAVRCNASSIIVAHNHPSGSVAPSKNDRDFTKVLMDCSKLFEIVLLDHIVVGRDTYYSFREQDYLFDKEIL